MTHRIFVVIAIVLFGIVFGNVATSYTEQRSLRPLAEGYVKLVRHRREQLVLQFLRCFPCGSPARRSIDGEHQTRTRGRPPAAAAVGVVATDGDVALVMSMLFS